MDIDWRQLKRDLFTVSKTFQHQDIFNAKAAPFNTGASHFTPQKPRTNDTVRSHVFQHSDIKNEYPNTPRGKRTFSKTSNIFGPDQPTIKTPSKHRLPDHTTDFFHNVDCIEPRQPLTGRNLSIDFSPKLSLKSPKAKKYEDLYASMGSYTPQPQREEATLPDRTLDSSIRTQDKRILHLESNIFNGAFSSKHSRKPSAKENSEDVEVFKRQNQNLSTMFGQTYGKQGPIGRERSQGRDISSDLCWINIDTIRNQKDIGQNHKIQQGPSPGRSRAMDFKSSMDTHDLYSSSKPSDGRMSNEVCDLRMNDPITRQKRKYQDLQDLHKKLKKNNRVWF